MKVGLYSVSYAGIWYEGQALTLRELIDRAKQFRYDGVEIGGKPPHGNPLDMPASLCQETRQIAADLGIEIYAVAAYNDFSSPVSEHRQLQLNYVRDLIRMTADLGAGILRIFAAWPGVIESPSGSRYDIAERVWTRSHDGFSSQDIWNWCREDLIEAARWAGDAGVQLALQNHPNVVSNYEDMLRMISDVASPSVKACFDAPLGRKQGVTRMREAANKVKGLQILSHFGGEYEEGPDGEILGYVRSRDGHYTREDFYVDFVAGMQDIGYAGYIGYELCHPLPKFGEQRAGIDFVDLNVRLAAKFMRQVIAAATEAKPR